MKTALVALAASAAAICSGQGLAAVQGGPTNLVATGRGDAGLRSYPRPKTAGELKKLKDRLFRDWRKRDFDALKAAVDNTLECADCSKFKEKYGENADFEKARPDAVKVAEDIKKYLDCLGREVKTQEARRKNKLLQKDILLAKRWMQKTESEDRKEALRIEALKKDRLKNGPPGFKKN